MNAGLKILLTSTPLLNPTMTESPSTFMLTERTLGMFTPLEIPADAFKKAYELPIGDHVEKNYKGLSYLSWPFAFRYLKQEFPSLYVSFEEERVGWPVFGQEGCWLLRPYLTDGTKRTPALVFPLMDNRHNALKQLDARAVSDNIQRASVKCIATFTGLGLKLYAGEDIPKDDGEASKPAPAAKKAAPSSKEAAGTIEGIGLELEKSFNGKESLLAFCKANPLQFPDERSSLKSGKTALENLGLAKGDDIKDSAMFANVISTIVTTWAKDNNIAFSKEENAVIIAKLRSSCDNASNAIEAVKEIAKSKK